MDIEGCLEVLKAVLEDRGLLAQVPEETRIAFLTAAGRVAHPTRLESIKLSRQIRAQNRQQLEVQDRRTRASTVIRRTRAAEVFVAPARISPDEAPQEDRELRRPRFCYVCKAEFRRLHFFYDSMCPSCAEFNYAKRHQSASLAGRTALVTGARIKIGYQTALMLLRAGAQVIVTTRFPRDAAQRYCREPDFEAWRGRLQIHGLGLRYFPSVEIFARYLSSSLERLDILINNAAQTVRRPPAFYAHLMERETSPLDEEPPRIQALLQNHAACVAALSVQPAREPDEESGANAAVGVCGLAPRRPDAPGVGLRQSALMSQIKYSMDDAQAAPELFPEGKTDADLQQVDLREKNSWRLTLSEVSTAEMLELQLINSVAPFILCSKLKPLMLRDRTGEKHIVNVSAMEGSFSRGTKTDKHPHTNMAKAALNMLTLTSAPDYAKSGIFMNAVDTGWVSDEDPALHAARKKDDLDFQPPLDVVDGAARVCDPIFSGLLSGEHSWGIFFKDYKPTAW
ncbi:MAG TPA: SDR family NAD(P)-dependent oxidoreductase [Elusimicrobiota bacterium]|nr:SDR family NAD(P)-dependent oxidoreductase [Elusimicrobiota bacterium]